MGRLEKIVVLTVLFLVAVVLGVALTPTGNPNQRGQKNGAVASGAGEQNAKDSAGKAAEEFVREKAGASAAIIRFIQEKRLLTS